jgi:hypothetical protein
MKKLPKKSKKFAYCQDWGTYSNETLVTVGMNCTEMLAYIKRNRFQFSETFPAKLKSFFDDEKGKSCAGACIFDDGRSILYFPSWYNCWDNWETLLHECYHLVFRICMRNKGMGDEDEAIAYQLEYLFRNIRLKLKSLDDRPMEKKGRKLNVRTK